MNEKDFGMCVFLFGAAVVLFGSVVHGVVTGAIPTLGGEGRYDTAILWQSREHEPRLFWFAVGFHLVVGGGAAWLGIRIARGKD